MAIKLGSKVVDSITGFEGIATARHEYLYGCVRITITPDKLHDGKPVDEQWFDEQRLNLVEVRDPVVSPLSSARTGGPQSAPPSRSMPR